MPKGVNRINEADPYAIRNRDEQFQMALSERSTGWEFLFDGRPCVTGISTTPGTKRPVRVDVPLAMSLGSGDNGRHHDMRPTE